MTLDYVVGFMAGYLACYLWYFVVKPRLGKL